MLPPLLHKLGRLIEAPAHGARRAWQAALQDALACLAEERLDLVPDLFSN
jgi:hypothetical protein